MKWDKLKEAILEDIVTNPKSEGAVALKERAKEQGTTVRQYLRTYDIRAVDALRQRFRHVFPTYLRTRMLWLNTDRKGNWTIDRELK